MAPTLEKLMKAKWIEGFDYKEYQIINVLSTLNIKKDIIKTLLSSDDPKQQKLYNALPKNSELRMLTGTTVSHRSVDEWLDNVSDEDIIRSLSAIVGYFEEDVQVSGKVVYISNYNMYTNLTGYEALPILRINFNTKTIWVDSANLTN